MGARNESERARVQHDIARVMLDRAYHDAARVDGLQKDWQTNYGDADAQTRPDLATLRSRSRQANANDPIAAGITQTVCTQEVGTGLALQSTLDRTALKLTDAAAEAIQDRLELGFRKWARNADYSQRMTFADMQWLSKLQVLESGEALLLRRMVPPAKRLGAQYSICYQMIEPDRLATPRDLASQEGLSISQGVETGEFGQPTAYWILKRHPGSDMNKLAYEQTSVGYNYVSDHPKTDFTRVPARDANGRQNVLHIYRMKRPDQNRGLPFFTPVLQMFTDVTKYMQAEWVRKRVAACVALFIKTGAADALTVARQQSTDATSTDSTRYQEFKPGMVMYGKEGEEPVLLDADIPGQSFEPFVRAAIRFIGAGLGLPPQMVDQSWETVNYSSARCALLEARKLFMCNQAFDAAHLCQPIYESLVEEMVLRDEVHLWGFDALRELWCAAEWIGNGWDWVDPEKEANSAEKEIALGTTTKTMICAAKGKDWNKIAVQRAAEQKMEKELGIYREPAVATKVKKSEPDGGDSNV